MFEHSEHQQQRSKIDIGPLESVSREFFGNLPFYANIQQSHKEKFNLRGCKEASIHQNSVQPHDMLI